MAFFQSMQGSSLVLGLVLTILAWLVTIRVRQYLKIRSLGVYAPGRPSYVPWGQYFFFTVHWTRTDLLKVWNFHSLRSRPLAVTSQPNGGKVSYKKPMRSKMEARPWSLMSSASV
jgi:hypothetical protein